MEFLPQILRIIYLLSMDQKVNENEKEYLEIIKFDRQFRLESCKNFSSFSDLTLRSSVDFVLVWNYFSYFFTLLKDSRFKFRRRTRKFQLNHSLIEREQLFGLWKNRSFNRFLSCRKLASIWMQIAAYANKVCLQLLVAINLIYYIDKYIYNNNITFLSKYEL